jgi:hypothetical protein
MSEKSFTDNANDQEKNNALWEKSWEFAGISWE